MIKLDENHPAALALRAEENKHSKLHQRLNGLNIELSRLSERRVRGNLEFEAAQLLVDAGESPAFDDRRVAEIQNQTAVLNKAIEMQQEAVDVARSRFSKELCRANHKTYIDIEKRLVAAVQELARCNSLERDFFESLKDLGCRTIYFRGLRVNAIGLSTDPQSFAALHLREVEQFLPEILKG